MMKQKISLITAGAIALVLPASLSISADSDLTDQPKVEESNPVAAPTESGDDTSATVEEPASPSSEKPAEPDIAETLPAEPAPTAETTAQSEPEPEPQLEPESETKPQTVIQAKPESNPTPKPRPEPKGSTANLEEIERVDSDQTNGRSAAEQDALSKVQAYLNGITTLETRFEQLNPNGQVLAGTLWMKRPGRLRFEYDPPTPFRVTADGTWLILEDEELDSVNRYPINSTPLSLLLRKDISLINHDGIQSVELGDQIIRITAIDPDAPQAGEITLIFYKSLKDDSLELKQWVVADAQNMHTRIFLDDIAYGGEIDSSLFHVSDFKGPSRR